MHDHQQVVQATTTLAVAWTGQTSYHSYERLAWKVLTLWVIVLVLLRSLQNQVQSTIYGSESQLVVWWQADVTKVRVGTEKSKFLR